MKPEADRDRRVGHAGCSTGRMRRGDLFSVGGVLARAMPRHRGSLPWTISALALCAAALWDPVVRGREIDFILLGLAGYELVIGLTERIQAHP